MPNILLYIIAFLLLVIVLSNETTRELLLRFLGIALGFIFIIFALFTIVIIVKLIFIGGLHNDLALIKSWYHLIMAKHSFFVFLLIAVLFAIVIVNFFRIKKK